VEEIGALGRLAKSQEMVALIGQKISVEQGTVDFENSQPITINLDNLSAGKALQKKDRNKEKLPEAFSDYTGRWHRILFPLLIFYSMIVFVHVATPSIFMDVVHTLMIVSVFTCIVIAITKQGKSNLHKPLRFITWTALCTYISIAGLMYVAFVISAIQGNSGPFGQPGISDIFDAFICSVDDINRFDNVFAIVCTLYIVAANLFLSCFGLYHITKIPVSETPVPDIPAVPDQALSKQQDASSELGVSVDDSTHP
jgi:hypothetical protein